MELLRTFSVSMIFIFNIWHSTSYTDSGPHEKHPNICGGYCRGNGFAGSGPCFAMPSPELEMCAWANDFCCPPNGDGSQWTTTTTLSPIACGGYCISGKSRLIECADFWTRQEEYNKCMWALRNCCPPSGDGSQWTTTTTTTTEKDEDAGKLATWVIVVIAVGAILFVALLVGLGICFCIYFNGQKRKRRVNPGGDATPAYGYPGTGARPGLYQPVIQPQSQFTNDSPFYA